MSIPFAHELELCAACCKTHLCVHSVLPEPCCQAGDCRAHRQHIMALHPDCLLQARIVVKPQDTFSNPVSAHHPDPSQAGFSIEITGPASTLQATWDLAAAKNGELAATYLPIHSGPCSVAVKYRGQHVQQSPYQVSQWLLQPCSSQCAGLLLYVYPRPSSCTRYRANSSLTQLKEVNIQYTSVNPLYLSCPVCSPCQASTRLVRHLR